MVGVWTSNNPIPFFSLHGSGLSWSKDSTSSKSGEWGFIFRQNRPKWKISWSVWPRRDYHTVFQTLHWIQMMVSPSARTRTAIQSRRIKSPETSKHTTNASPSTGGSSFYRDHHMLHEMEDTCLGCSVSCTWSSWRSPVLWLFVL